MRRFHEGTFCHVLAIIQVVGVAGDAAGALASSESRGRCLIFESRCGLEYVKLGLVERLDLFEQACNGLIHRPHLIEGEFIGDVGLGECRSEGHTDR